MNFQQQVHEFFEDKLKIKFDSEEHVSKVISANEIDINGIKKIVHPNLRFDGYTKITSSFRDIMGLDSKWKAIAFEAHGMWHVDLKTFLGMFPYKTVAVLIEDKKLIN